MLLNNYYWKDELLLLSEEIERFSEYVEDEELDAPDVPYSMFRLEKALLYSAFAVRLLFESKKLTDKMRGFNLTVERIPNIVENPKERAPLFRKFATDDNYDYSERKKRSISGFDLANQLIHSLVALSFDYVDNKAVSFYVASDRVADDELYCCSLESWRRYLLVIAEDEIAYIDTRFDYDKGKWVVSRR